MNRHLTALAASITLGSALSAGAFAATPSTLVTQAFGGSVPAAVFRGGATVNAGANFQTTVPSRSSAPYASAVWAVPIHDPGHQRDTCLVVWSDFATAPKQAAQGEVSFNGLVIDAHHLEKVLQRLIRLLVEQEVEALQVVDIEWRRAAFTLLALTEAAKRPTGRRQQEKQSCQEESGFSRHRIAAGCAGC